LFEKARGIASRSGVNASSLIESLGVTQDTAAKLLDRLEKQGAEWNGRHLRFAKPDTGRLSLSFLQSGKPIRIGLVGDTHLGSTHARLDALNLQYDLFASEGITNVLHAGNIVDGHIPRINGGDLVAHSIDDQVLFCIDNYPKRKGITTHYITGDDHEGWWQKEGFNFGRYLMHTAKQEGRDDLNYLGHVEADVVLQSPRGKTMLKIQHPGGGSCYARSYTSQKIVESLEGGEKPHFLVLGHYHVSSYIVERNVHVISLPGFQDQTIFARKKRLRMEIGGSILQFHTTEAGTPSRVSVEFNMFYNRGFYKPYLRSDAGRMPELVIK
jgi:predicted phosphodiesterase